MLNADWVGRTASPVTSQVSGIQRSFSETTEAMNNQDPIADMLTRIRNANRVGRRMVLIPRSKICLGIAQVLKDEGYIEQFDAIQDDVQGQIRVKLKYSMNGEKV